MPTTRYSSAHILPIACIPPPKQQSSGPGLLQNSRHTESPSSTINHDGKNELAVRQYERLHNLATDNIKVRDFQYQSSSNNETVNSQEQNNHFQLASGDISVKAGTSPAQDLVGSADNDQDARSQALLEKDQGDELQNDGVHCSSVENTTTSPCSSMASQMSSASLSRSVESKAARPPSESSYIRPIILPRTTRRTDSSWKGLFPNYNNETSARLRLQEEQTHGPRPSIRPRHARKVTASNALYHVFIKDASIQEAREYQQRMAKPNNPVESRTKQSIPTRVRVDSAMSSSSRAPVTQPGTSSLKLSQEQRQPEPKRLQELMSFKSDEDLYDLVPKSAPVQAEGSMKTNQQPRNSSSYISSDKDLEDSRNPPHESVMGNYTQQHSPALTGPSSESRSQSRASVFTTQTIMTAQTVDSSVATMPPTIHARRSSLKAGSPRGKLERSTVRASTMPEEYYEKPESESILGETASIGDPYTLHDPSNHRESPSFDSQDLSDLSFPPPFSGMNQMEGQSPMLNGKPEDEDLYNLDISESTRPTWGDNVQRSFRLQSHLERAAKKPRSLSISSTNDIYHFSSSRSQRSNSYTSSNQPLDSSVFSQDLAAISAALSPSPLDQPFSPEIINNNNGYISNQTPHPSNNQPSSSFPRHTTGYISTTPNYDSKNRDASPDPPSSPSDDAIPPPIPISRSRPVARFLSPPPWAAADESWDARSFGGGGGGKILTYGSQSRDESVMPMYLDECSRTLSLGSGKSGAAYGKARMGRMGGGFRRVLGRA